MDQEHRRNPARPAMTRGRTQEAGPRSHAGHQTLKRVSPLWPKVKMFEDNLDFEINPGGRILLAIPSRVGILIICKSTRLQFHRILLRVRPRLEVFKVVESAYWPCFLTTPIALLVFWKEGRVS